MLPCTLLIGVGAGVPAHQQYPARTTTKQALVEDRAKAANKAYEMLFDRSRRSEAPLPDCEAVYQWSRPLKLGHKPWRKGGMGRPPKDAER